MSDKKLTILGIVAVALAGLAILQSRISRQAGKVDFSSAPLIAGLNIEKVSAIEITSAGGSKTVRLSQQNRKFGLAGKDNYPADVSKINRLINNCLDIRVTDKITSNAANHADLKVTKDTAETWVAFLGTDGNPVVAAAISPREPEKGTAHGRLDGSDDVYAIQSPPWISTGELDYVDAELLTVTKQKIGSIAVKTPEGGYVLVATEGGNDATLENMPEGKQFKGTDYQSVFGALSSLRFEDVAAVTNVPADVKFDYGYTCKLKDLTVYTLKLGKKDDKVYAKVSATYLDATPVEKTVGEVETEEELKKKEAKLLAIDQVKAFTAQHREWVYQIPSYQADNLTKPLAELLEDVPTPEPEEQPQEEPAKKPNN